MASRSWQRGPMLSALIVGATAAAFATMLLAATCFGAGSAVAVLAAVLTLSRARRPAGAPERYGWLLDLLSLPLIATLAAALAVLLHRHFAVGALLFAAAVSVATWLPALGARGRTFGTAASLPLIAVLIVPGSPHAPGGPWADLLLVVLAAWVAQIYARLARLFAGLMRLNAVHASAAAVAARPKAGRISGHLRMALQMAAALLAAFAIGYPMFGPHWRWCVLTAYIVCAGGPSRGEVVYKGLLRLLGALLGTLVAALVQKLFAPQGLDAALLIFASLFVGVWLREFNYAFWAGCMTLTMAILQAAAGTAAPGELNVRLLAILAGALCAVLSAWLLMPLSTRRYARRLLADVLVALDRSLQSGEQPHRDELARCVTRLERIAPVLNLHRFVTGAGPESDHPAFWLVLTLNCSRSIPNFEGDRPALIRAIGLTRRSLSRREGSVHAALRVVDAMASGAQDKR